MTTEQVVLLDESGRAIGVADKATVHHQDTPLHLAFSCYLFDPAGRLLITRRALSKTTWPGVWTNSVCGHPGPGEDQAAAIGRRAAAELGVQVDQVTPLLPHFRYWAVAADGVVENEICPVFRAVVTGDPTPEPAEVMEWAWIEPAALATAVAAAPMAFSPWAVEQVQQLVAAGLWSAQG